MRNSIFETILVAVVILVAGIFLVFALNSTDSSGTNGSYELQARFNDVTGIVPGSDVMVAGVKVGRVLDIEMDAERFEAVVTLSMDESVTLPDDSDARVISNLFGGAHVAVEAGGGGYGDLPKDGSGEIMFTRGSVDILTLFASFAGGQGGDSSSAD